VVCLRQKSLTGKSQATPPRRHAATPPRRHAATRHTPHAPLKRRHTGHHRIIECQTRPLLRIHQRELVGHPVLQVVRREEEVVVVRVGCAGGVSPDGAVVELGDVGGLGGAGEPVGVDVGAWVGLVLVNAMLYRILYCTSTSKG
jgi:hypothetical protein